MTQAQSLSESINAIRRRLLRLLITAYTTTVTLIVVITLVVTAWVVNTRANQDSLYRSVVAYILEVYYQGRGSWDGVEAVLANGVGINHDPLPLDWRNLTLVDRDNRVVLENGQRDSDLAGQPLPAESSALRNDLYVDGQYVGAMIYTPRTVPSPRAFLISIMLPITLSSLLLALLTMVIGGILIRRLITPLAAVMGAAQSVASGNLATRVPVSGPTDDLRDLGEHFNRMAEALQRSDRERRNLLADVTHELRTPLTVLRGRLEGIVDGVYPADEAHIAPALEETYLLERLVEDLRLLTLAETRQLRFEPRLCDLGEIVERVAQLFEAEAGEKGIHLETRIAAPLPEVRVDPQRVEQVVGNLISNALRYAPENSPVVVEVVSDGERVSVSVRDRGPGVSEADLPNIFDRFWRGEKSRSRATGGAGLGLAIARNLVEAQHGRIFAHNQPEGGLVVGFSFARG